MIVEFSIMNFRSIREMQTISLIATGLKSPSDLAEVDRNNIAEVGGTRFLKTLGIYGANASGKSNIIRGLEYFLTAIKREPSSESNLGDLCDPFLYQENSSESVSFFQIVLFVNGKKFRYGFTVKNNPSFSKDPVKKDSKEIVTSEWLYGTKGKNLVEYFTRQNGEVDKEKLPSNEKIPELPYKHALFLTHSAAFDRKGDVAAIRKYIINFTLSNFTRGIAPFRSNTLFLLEHEKRKDDFLELLSTFDLKYKDIFVDRDPNKPKQIIVPQEKIFMIKSFRDKNNKQKDVKLNLGKNESSGTKKLFDLAGLLLRAFYMDTGGFIILDEIDNNFHPSLLIKLIGLFNNPKLNRSKTQLIFTSHDTNLMHPSIMRRDQFYFTEKNENNSTRLYSLADLKGIRNDADFAKQYLAGYYGAVPVLEEYISKNPIQNV